MRRLFPLLATLALSWAGALDLSGSAGPELSAGSRLGLFLVNSVGKPQDEVVSAPVSGGRFSVSLPTGAPPASAQYPLRRETIAWPGIFDPVSVGQGASAAELRAYVYTDANGDGRFDAGEPRFEAPLQAGRDAVVLVWVDADTRVQAARGFDATLRRGWNALSITPGKSVKVAPYAGAALTLNVLK